MIEEPIIRRMLIDDIVAVDEIEQSSYFEPWPASAFFDFIRGGHCCYVLLHERRIVAYIVWQEILNECHLLNLCVDSEFRCRGFAAALMQFAITTVREKNLERIILEVRASNISAIHLYEKFGFKQMGLRKNYYITANGPENAITYQLLL